MSDQREGETAASRWLNAVNQVREQTAIVAELDPFQACRVGFTHGGHFALDCLLTLMEEGGASLDEALTLVRAHWAGAVTTWANAPTVPGQEVYPLIVMEPLQKGVNLRLMHAGAAEAPAGD